MNFYDSVFDFVIMSYNKFVTLAQQLFFQAVVYALSIGMLVAIAIFGIAFFWAVSLGWDLFMGIGKYEGMSAQEWADRYYAENEKYQNLYSCVEQYTYARKSSGYCL